MRMGHSGDLIGETPAMRQEDLLRGLGPSAAAMLELEQQKYNVHCMRTRIRKYWPDSYPIALAAKSYSADRYTGY